MLESAMSDFKSTQDQLEIIQNQMEHGSDPAPLPATQQSLLNGLNLIASTPVLVSAPQKVEDTFYSPENMPIHKIQETAQQQAARQSVI